MKSRKAGATLLFILCVVMLAACNRGSAATVIEMEMTQSYDNADPFIHEKLFYVTEDIDSLKLNVTFEMQGDTGLLEIAENQEDKAFYSKSWDGNIEKTEFTISLAGLEKEKEYVIRFTGTKISNAKIRITSENGLVKERARPSKN